MVPKALRDAYPAEPPPLVPRRAPFHVNETLERLHHLITTDPAAAGAVTPSSRLQLGFYLEAKAAAAAENPTPPDAGA